MPMMPSPSRRLLLLTVLPCAFAAAAARAEEAVPNKPGYVPLGEFTVNLPSQDGAQSYALLDLTLEAVPGAAQALHDILPRLKETALRQLMAMAEKGELAPGHTDPAAVKTLLLDAMGKLQPGAVRDVLITKLIYG